MVAFFHKTVGSILFFIFFIAWLIGLALLGLPLLCMHKSITVRWVKLWGRGVLAGLRILCGIDYKIEGWEHLPARPFIIAAKHQSAFETIALYTMMEDVVVILKRELLWIPFYGWYVSKVKMIPINREKGIVSLRQILDKTYQTLTDNRILLIFPEGTRRKPGDPPAYKAGISAIYQHAQVPVVPLSLNSGLFWGKRQFFKKPGTVRLVFQPSLPAGLSKQEFMLRLQNMIESGCQSLYNMNHGKDPHQSG